MTAFALGSILAGAVILLGLLSRIARFYKKVEQGKALVINRFRPDTLDVTFTGAFVLPIIDKAELMDISVKTLEIDRRAEDGEGRSPDWLCCEVARAAASGAANGVETIAARLLQRRRQPIPGRA